MSLDILKQIQKDFDTGIDFRGDEIVENWSLIENLDLKVGDWIKWCYEEDYNFYKNEGFDDELIKTHYLNYRGIIVPMHDITHFDLSQNAILIITEYPCEKCSPETTYTSFVSFLGGPGLKMIVKD